MEETEQNGPEREEVAESAPAEKPEEEAQKEKQAPEVIARKARGYMAALIFTMIFSIFMAIVGAVIVAVGIAEGGNVPMYLVASVMFAGGVGLVVYSAFSMHRIRRIPQVVISREGDTISFFITKKFSFSCKASEITNVSYFQSYGRGQTRPWGTLVIYFGERELKLVYIKDVVAAHNRLFSLILEYKKTETKKKAEEAEKPEEIKAEE